MKMHMKIISMILTIGILVGSVSVNTVEAKTVEVKTKSGNSELKINILNETLDYRLEEVAFKIKNKSGKKIKVTRISMQYKSSGKWTTLKKQNKSAAKRKTVITAGSTVYDSINLNTDYVIPNEGLNGGKYAVYVKYKYKGKYFYKRKVFRVEGKEVYEAESQSTEAAYIETTTEENTTNQIEETTTEGEQGTTSQQETEVTTKVPTMSAAPTVTVVDKTVTNKASATTAIHIKLVNTDFSIDKTGRASLMVFSEADYSKAEKTKINISIQRKTKGKWKKYKSYKITKKSNIAFVNRQLKIKKRGTYRMWGKITFYGKGKKRRQYKIKSKKQIY